MIRLILIAIVLFLFWILSWPLWGIEWILGKLHYDRARDMSSLRIVQAVLKLITFLAGTKVTVIGEDNIPQDEAALFIGNHRSYFDVVLTYSRCRRLTGYVAKTEFERFPLLPRWMRLLHCLFLDRSDMRQGLKTILSAVELVNSGVSITIFPEGTRGKAARETELLPFHMGSFKIATKTGCPIVPVTISNSSAIFEDHVPWVKSAHVTIEYGQPIYTRDLSREEQKNLGNQVQAVILETLERNSAGLIHPDRTAKKEAPKSK